jgi:hypothetical protein
MDSTQTLSIDPSSSPTREVYANAVLGTNRKEAWAEMREKSKKVEPVRSVSGSLFVSVCGFIKRKQETRFKANNDMYNVEIMAYPEENKFVLKEKGLILFPVILILTGSVISRSKSPFLLRGLCSRFVFCFYYFRSSYSNLVLEKNCVFEISFVFWLENTSKI